LERIAYVHLPIACLIHICELGEKHGNDIKSFDKPFQ
jgi:hypothetical protein